MIFTSILVQMGIVRVRYTVMLEMVTVQDGLMLLI